MNFASAPNRRPTEAILPMINVVFLLLIFFLMTAKIAPRAPFAVAPPATLVEALAEGHEVLFVSADGALHFGAADEVAIWAALEGFEGILTLRADAGLSAVTFAGLLARLNDAGVVQVELVAVPR
ncbi:biopolymer transporter ExbD [Aliiroseovarius subalbicans]|uniref:ExbD/TolR family protein n=1 Tax=Aliiroseovarius subalbicans TaxID=2925840 RepID=UPI001F571620|nr:biopolymer transporter ExbD [Aliiroseovarius subalbicans]MCI2399226.1 biopolymer transporter ExbD [Aliiroseovarius subalbicans]